MIYSNEKSAFNTFSPGPAWSDRNNMITHKYKVAEPRKLKSWERIARGEICIWINDEAYRKEVTETTLKGERLGPFTKFLYHFAHMCECGWGVMIDFDERKQRTFLPDHYYKWMHKLRDEILEAYAINDKIENDISNS